MMSKPSAYLLDTHVFLWALDCPDKLSQDAQQVLLASDTELFISRVSYWEICLKISKGTLVLGDHWQKRFEDERQRNRWNWLELTPAHCEGIIDLPQHHKDPFDRMLISQAMCEELVLISCDGKFGAYDVEVQW